MVQENTSCASLIHCACLIHDTLYDWAYVDKLYNSLQRNLTPKVILHVYTEPFRAVPAPYVKHDLVEWPGIRGPRQSWWYKIQLFNTAYYSGPMLYLDLDTIIVGNLDWICNLSLDYFWAVRDFQYLFRPTSNNINSSVMWFDTTKFSNVFTEFNYKELHNNRKYRGDQDYLNIAIPERKFFDTAQIKSWRWEISNGGYDRTTAKPKANVEPSIVSGSIVIFHGDPKPHAITDNNILQHWQ